MSTTPSPSAGWVRLGEVIPPRALADARLQFHHAAQIVVSAAISYLPARPDDSHTALTWASRERALVSEPIPASDTTRVAVQPETLTLHLFDGAMRSLHSFALAGHRIADATDWLAAAAASAGLDPTRLTSRKHYAIPAHPVATGAVFTTGSDGELGELASYWDNAARVLEAFSARTAGASAVRTWPHHFDIATLVTLPDDAHRGQRTIGVGQSPGDDSYAEPYWYVGPYPHPKATELPPLDGGGGWHTEGWFGAALPASAYVTADDQRGVVEAFMASAVAACRRLLEHAQG